MSDMVGNPEDLFLHEICSCLFLDNPLIFHKKTTCMLIYLKQDFIWLMLYFSFSKVKVYKLNRNLCFIFNEMHILLGIFAVINLLVFCFNILSTSLLYMSCD